MKHILIMLMCVLTLVFSPLSTQAQVQRKGNTFSMKKQSNKKSYTLVQTYCNFETSEGVLPIYINKSNGRCYVIRTSKKTGKQYKQALNEDVCKAVCKELNINYNYKLTKNGKN